VHREKEEKNIAGTNKQSTTRRTANTTAQEQGIKITTETGANQEKNTKINTLEKIVQIGSRAQAMEDTTTHGDVKSMQNKKEKTRRKTDTLK